MYNIGLLYEGALGVREDRNEAIIWYRTAADAGNAAARERLKSLSGKE
jgi:TPR repeat protein